MLGSALADTAIVVKYSFAKGTVMDEIHVMRFGF